jgi:peptidoglycan/xylan/chitin deacetylase (PgdA/CDA1 family)
VGRDAPAILMYHRVASPPFDPWGLCVSPERFREQLEALKHHRRVLSMDNLVAALESGDVPPGSVALTFDDGYADNAEVAKPLLEALQVPATMFLTSGLIGSERPFWWDELAAWVLGGRDAADIELEVAGVQLAARWSPQDGTPADLPQWRVGDATADPRRLSYVRLWSALQPMSASDRNLAMATLRRQLGADGRLPPDPMGLPMTADAVRSLSSQVIDLGGHGRTHVPLPMLPPKVREQEIAGGRSELASLAGIGQPRGFAYPHGEWDSTTREMVIGAGYRWAVTTSEAKINRRRHDPFALPRLKIGNWSGEALVHSIGRAAVQ